MAAGRWRLNLCGINHKTASVAEREPLGIGQEDYAEAHAEFAALDQVLEATIVSTCNRTEFYFVAPRTSDPFEIVFDYYDRLRGIDIWPLRDKFYVHYNTCFVSPVGWTRWFSVRTRFWARSKTLTVPPVP